jgi:hypothetical protein
VTTDTPEIAVARAALDAFDNPPTETRSRAWGEHCLGAQYTIATGEPFECEVDGLRVEVSIGTRAGSLPPVPECKYGGWNERYFAHVGRALVARFPHLDAEAEALRTHRHMPVHPEPDHLRNVLAAHDRLRAALAAVEPHLDAGRCYRYDEDDAREEVPTTLAERARCVALALAAEAQGHNEAREEIARLRAALDHAEEARDAAIRRHQAYVATSERENDKELAAIRRLREERDRLDRTVERLFRGWETALVDPVERAAMAFASAWAREAPYAAGLAAVHGLRAAVEERVAEVAAERDAAIAALSGIAGNADSLRRTLAAHEASADHQPGGPCCAELRAALRVLEAAGDAAEQRGWGLHRAVEERDEARRERDRYEFVLGALLLSGRLDDLTGAEVRRMGEAVSRRLAAAEAVVKAARPVTLWLRDKAETWLPGLCDALAAYDAATGGREDK